GIKVTGNDQIVLHDNPDGSQGIYYIGSQGLSITNAGGITGSNVMLYSNGTGNISLTESGSMSLSPPTSGIYKGITLFQERSSNKQISITAQGNMDMSGTFYAAAARPIHKRSPSWLGHKAHHSRCPCIICKFGPDMKSPGKCRGYEAIPSVHQHIA